VLIIKYSVFAGLYFRGEWAEPFSALSDKKKFESVNGEQDVNFMMVDGNFKFADVRSKQLIAVEFPYKNEKYSLTIIMPDTFKDLKYISKSSDYNLLNEISSQLEPTDLKVIVPKFRVEFTSKADKALGAVNNIFYY
jgi:serpin B